MGLQNNIIPGSSPPPAGGPEATQRIDDVRILTINIITADGTTIDITNDCSNVIIRENMFEHCLHGIATNFESKNLPSNIPLTGSEGLHIVFNSPGHPEIDKLFVIDKLTPRMPLDNKQSQLYDIHFVEPLFIQSMFNKISKSYKTSISAMVSDIFKNYLTNEAGIELVDVEPTLGEQTLLIPNFNPMKAIHWLSKRAIADDEHTSCNYVFYQDLSGFHFLSVGTLFDESPVHEYVFGATDLDDTIRDNPKSDIDLNKTYSNMKNLVIDGFDRSLETHKGTWSSVMIYHDIINKNYGKVTYDYSSDFETSRHINTHPIIPNYGNYSPQVDSKHYFVPVHLQLHGQADTQVEYRSGNDGFFNYIQKHDANLTQLKSSSIRFDVGGDSDRRVGDIVSVIVHSFEGSDFEDNIEIDKMVSGNYIITSIEHNISNSSKGHTLKLKLSKDSYIDSLPTSQESIINTPSPTDMFDNNIPTNIGDFGGYVV